MTHVTMPQEVVIREVGPREGFQILPRVVPVADRLRLIEALVAASVRHIEVASFVRGDKVPQMADAEELVSRLPQADGVEFTALCLNAKGFERAEKTGRLKNSGWIYTSPSNSFLKANSNLTLDGSVAQVPEWAKLFRAHGKRLHGIMVSTAFGCSYEGSISASTVVSLVKRFAAACESAGEKVSEICLADTVGMGSPKTVRECLTALRPLGIPVSLHLHDTMGLGLVNAYAGLLEGVSIFETSVGGMGGCPFTPGAAGNVATEDLVYLCNELGIKTNIDLDRLCKAAELAELIVGTELPGRVYRARSAQKSCK
jgi:hydroxymethylglutaryl-CoA lyase